MFDLYCSACDERLELGDEYGYPLAGLQELFEMRDVLAMFAEAEHISLAVPGTFSVDTRWFATHYSHPIRIIETHPGCGDLYGV